jgi:hypothetical protein
MFSQSCLRENDFFCVMCKTKFGAKIGVARDIFFYTQDIKNIGFPQKLERAYRMSRCTC